MPNEAKRAQIKLDKSLQVIALRAQETAHLKEMLGGKDSSLAKWETAYDIHFSKVEADTV